MRALTHPVRLALLQALELEGPLTATQAGELIGEPPNTCSTDLHEDPETAIAARGLDRMLREQYFQRLAAFYESRSGYPLAWQEVTGGSQALLHVTPEELKGIDEQFMALLAPFIDRALDPAERPAGSLPIEVLLFAYPVRPPAK